MNCKQAVLTNMKNIRMYLLVLIYMTISPKPSVGDSVIQVNSTGVHCGNITTRDDVNLSLTDHFHCIECLYPHNCLPDNLCRLGTTGSTCEKCVQYSDMKGYHRLGGMCVECPSFPWSAVSFGVYLLLMLAAVFYHGLSWSFVTKLKLLCHFLQYLLLTFHIKIVWSKSLTQLFDVVNIGSYNSNILLPECLFHMWPAISTHYLEWLTSLSVPVIVFVFGMFLDSSMKKISRLQSSKQPHGLDVSRSHSQKKRTTLRRLVVMVVIMMYMPSTLSCIRTFLCSDTIPKYLVLDHTQDIFLLDNSESCSTFVFQTVHFFGMIYFFVIGIGFPCLLIFFTLRQKKWDLLYSQWALYSPIYESYKDRYCFWEAIPMLRKLVSLLVTETYPISPFLQTATQLGISVVYLLSIIALRPYRDCYWRNRCVNIHLMFEIVSNLVVCMIQIVALSVVLQWYDTIFDLVGQVCICIVLAFWLFIFAAMVFEETPELNWNDIEDSHPTSSSTPIQRKKGFKFWKKTKIDQDPAYIERINKNKTNVNF